ncbi:MAG: transcription elongation factor GreA [Patescibacteria group bacterium]
MTQYFSAEGLEKLKQELAEREGTIRAEIARRILDAKELGDLSENAEYAEARESQGMNEGRIQELQDIIKNAIVIGPNQQNKTVMVGSTVSVKFNGNERQFTIVGPSESNPTQGFISNESPLGMAFIGKKKGEEFEVLVPSGKMKYKILDIK